MAHGPVAQLVRAPACHAGGRRFEPVLGRHNALVAQLVEQQTENLPVGGSIPPQGTKNTRRCSSMAEQLICNQQVVGSSPITGSTTKLNIWADSRVAKWIRL